MRRPAVSFVLSLLLNSGAGWLLGRWISLTNETVIISAVFVSAILHLLFFYIRRWDGCIEKLGGLTFSFLTLAAIWLPLFLIRRENAGLTDLVCSLTALLSVQTALTGWIATVWMRTRNFRPPKPGEPLRW